MTQHQIWRYPMLRQSHLSIAIIFAYCCEKSSVMTLHSHGKAWKSICLFHSPRLQSQVSRVCNYRSIYLPTYLSIYLPTYVSIYLPIYLPIHLSIYLSIYLCIYIYISMYMYIIYLISRIYPHLFFLALALSDCRSLAVSIPMFFRGW